MAPDSYDICRIAKNHLGKIDSSSGLSKSDQVLIRSRKNGRYYADNGADQMGPDSNRPFSENGLSAEPNFANDVRLTMKEVKYTIGSKIAIGSYSHPLHKMGISSSTEKPNGRLLTQQPRHA